MILIDVYKRQNNKEVVIPVVRARERTAAAATTGISDCVVTKVNKELWQLENWNEGDRPTSFVILNKKWTKAKPVTGLDDFDQGVVRWLVHELYTIKKQLPTAERLREELQKRTEFTGSNKCAYIPERTGVLLGKN